MLEMDPDVLASALGLTTPLLLLAFKSKVSTFLDQECGPARNDHNYGEL